jgi:hypothetical protein
MYRAFLLNVRTLHSATFLNLLIHVNDMAVLRNKLG